MKIGDAKQVIKKIVAENIQRVPLLIGESGIGKSMVVQQIGEELNIPVVDRRLAQLEPGDLTGIPRPDEMTKKTVWYKPDWFPTEGRGIVFFDEINRAPRDMQQSVFQILTEWQMHCHKLPDGWSIVAAINPEDAAYHVEPMDPAMRSRMMCMYVGADVDDWSKWATSADVNPLIIRFINAQKELLCKVLENESFPCPRSWTTLSLMMKKGVIPTAGPLQYELMAGVVGKEAARGFIGWVENQYKAITGEEVLNSYNEVLPKLSKQKEDENNSTISDLLAIMPPTVKGLKPEQITNIRKYILMLPSEFKFTLLKGLHNKCSTLVTTFARDPEILDIISKLADRANQEK